MDCAIAHAVDYGGTLIFAVVEAQTVYGRGILAVGAYIGTTMIFWLQRGFTIMDTMMCGVTLIYKVYLFKDLMFTVDRSSTLTLAFSKMVTAVALIFLATLVATVMSTVLVFLISVGNTLALAVAVGLTHFLLCLFYYYLHWRYPRSYWKKSMALHFHFRS